MTIAVDLGRKATTQTKIDVDNGTSQVCFKPDGRIY